MTDVLRTMMTGALNADIVVYYPVLDIALELIFHGNPCR